MEDKLNPTAVGAFVLLLGAAMVAAILWLAAGVQVNKDTNPYQSIFTESVAGLNTDAPVKYLGVDVGKVSTIAIDPNNSRQVLLGFDIKQGTPVKEDSEAVLKTQGLTGIVYVELSGGSPGSAPLVATAQTPAPLITSKPSLSTRLENVLSTVLTSVDALSGSLNAVLDPENRAALKETLAQAAAMSRTLAQASKRLEPALLRVTAAAQSVEDLGQVAGKATEKVGEQLGEAATTANQGMSQIQGETLPEIHRLLVEMQSLSTALRTLAEQTERQPNSLVVGAPKRSPGPGERPIP